MTVTPCLVFWRALMFVSAALMCAALGTDAHAEEAAARIVYFDPDANHAAILRIAADINAFLKAKNIPWEFQPVNSVDAWTELMRDTRTKFVVIPSALVDNAGTPVSPLLVPTANGNASYVKLLLDNSQGKAGDLRGKTIAVTASADISRKNVDKLLASLRGAGLSVDESVVVPVSKDIDALLALSFSQVGAALVTSESVEILKRINPHAAERFRKVYETQPILRSPLCEIRGRVQAPDREKLIAAFVEMGSESHGLAAMRSMGIDHWIPYDKAVSAR